MAQEAPSSKPNDQSNSDGYPIKIFIYDLSQGMASTYSQQLIGKQVDGIWHTSVIVYEKEYFYGGGIQSDNPGKTPYGTPLRRLDMGTTYKTQSEFHEHLQTTAPNFSPEKYDLFKHNCNTFADVALKFLNGRNIPEYITSLPEEFLNSAVGQMLKPMIDNMQQTAMAQYGDWGGVGVAAKPHLPPLNPKYNNKIVRLNKDMDMDNIKETVSTDGLKDLLDKHRTKHAHVSMDLKLLSKELGPKITCDDRNGELYISMIVNNDLISDVHKEALNECNRYLKNKRKMKVNDATFEILDELLLMTECEHLFALVSLLRLLLIDASIAKRYCIDFMIINQILYKIGIVFEKEDEEESKASDEMEMNVMDIYLLQFTSIAAVSHLYLHNDVTVGIDDGFINLGLNALNVNNCNVRLSASRLLFNMVYDIKSKMLMDEDSQDGLKEALNKIVKGVWKHVNNEKHIPTLYRLLCILGLILYCNDLSDEVLNELQLNKDRMNALIDVINGNIQPQNEYIQLLQNDIVALL